MDKEFRFYLDGVELDNDIQNFNDIDFVLVRNSEFWGYFRGAALSNLDFVKNDAKKVRKLWEDGSINNKVVFRIDTINRIFNTYELFQSGILDFNSYSEKTSVNGAETVSVGFNYNTSQEKVKGRGSNNLVIGDNESIEGVTLTGNSLIDVLYKRSKQRFFSGWRWSTYLQNVSMGAPAESTVPTFTDVNRSMTGTMNAPIGLELMNSNDNAAQSEVSQGMLYGLYSTGLIFSSSPVTRQVNIDMDFAFKMSAVLPDFAVNGLSYKLRVGVVEYSFDNSTGAYTRLAYVTTPFEQTVTISTADVAPITSTEPYDGALDGVWASSYRFKSFDFNVATNQSFTKKADFYYGLDFNVISVGSTVYEQSIHWYGEIETDGDNTLTTYYDDLLNEYPDSSHKSSLVFEALDSTLQQITDKPTILRSNFFGRTENGYASDGGGSLLSITSGFMLRNAVNSDGTPIDLTLNFKDLYKTLDSIFGLAMWWDGEFLNIEKREDAFGSIETELTYSELSSEVMSELIYTGVKVGNKRIPYEDVNGTNEHNTILEFTTPLNTEENLLELVTKYNTDYTGIERARRLSFQNSDNVDTKYDEKIFLSVVERDGAIYKTVLGFTGYDVITGVNLPGEAGNLDLSPKRMLLNNIDLISSSFWKVDEPLLYKTSENLSTLQSEKTGGSLVVEQSNVLKVNMTGMEVKPFKHTLVVGKKDIVDILNNPLNYYYFYKGKEKIVCELWSASIKNNKGTVELIEK